MDDFDEVIDSYFRAWIAALDVLEPFPFAAACLACVILDHVGNARIAVQPPPDEHTETYCRFVRKYLTDFPDDQDLRKRFYRALRSGLVHEARTDGHRNPDTQVMISHEDFLPETPVGSDPLEISVPWLCRSVKAAWDETRAMQDGPTRERIAERLKMHIKEAPQDQAGGASMVSGNAESMGVYTGNRGATGIGTFATSWDQVERLSEERARRDNDR